MEDTDKDTSKTISELVSEYYKRLDEHRSAAKIHIDRFFQGIDADIDELERNLNRE